MYRPTERMGKRTMEPHFTGEGKIKNTRRRCPIDHTILQTTNGKNRHPVQTTPVIFPRAAQLTNINKSTAIEGNAPQHPEGYRCNVRAQLRVGVRLFEANGPKLFRGLETTQEHLHPAGDSIHQLPQMDRGKMNTSGPACRIDSHPHPEK